MSPIKKYTVNSLSAEIKQKLFQILDQKEMNNPTIEVTACGAKGDNYVGILYRIIATDDKSRKLRLVCKTESTLDVIKEMFSSTIAFRREILVYSEILPLYKTFQEQHGILENKRFDNHPKSCGNGEGFLIMHDLHEEGYVLYDRFKDLDFIHAKIAVEALGRFHAIGYALKDQRPDVIHKLKGQLTEVFFGNNVGQAFSTEVRIAIDLALEIIDEEDVRKKLRYFYENVEEMMSKLVSSEDAEPYAVINHGDVWTNNVMYKYENDKPIGVCLLDYQYCRYGSPALDLSYYIFCCTTQEFREKYYTSILRAYHLSLSEMLECLGSDPTTIFPFTALEEQMSQYGALGLIMSIVIAKVLICKGDDINDQDKVIEMKSSNDGGKNYSFISDNETKERYTKNIVGNVKDAVKYGIRMSK